MLSSYSVLYVIWTSHFLVWACACMHNTLTGFVKQTITTLRTEFWQHRVMSDNHFLLIFNYMYLWIWGKDCTEDYELRNLCSFKQCFSLYVALHIMCFFIQEIFFWFRRANRLPNILSFLKVDHLPSCEHVYVCTKRNIFLSDRVFSNYFWWNLAIVKIFIVNHLDNVCWHLLIK